jgi:hypothetical protein
VRVKWKIAPSQTLKKSLIDFIYFLPSQDPGGRQVGAVHLTSSPASPHAAGLTAFPATPPSYHFAPQTSSPYIQRAVVVASADGPAVPGVAEAFWPGLTTRLDTAEPDLSALSLAASPTAQASAEVEAALARAAFEAAGARTQQLGLPVLDPAFGGGRPGYQSRPPGRPHYPPAHKTVVDRGEHEDIKVIHFGVV